MRSINLIKFAWGLALPLAVLVLFTALAPAGARLLVNRPYLSTALAVLAFLRLTVWAGRVWLPDGRSQFDWQAIAAITFFAGIAGLAAWSSSNRPIRSLLAAGGGTALLVGLTRRIVIGEISEIESGEVDTDQRLRIIRLPTWRFEGARNAAAWGAWQPLASPAKARVVLERPLPPRTDDRSFALTEDEERLEVVVRTKTATLSGLQPQALIVIVSGIFGKWLYIVGYFPRTAS